VTDIAVELDISCESAYSVIQDDLRYQKVCASWLSKWLTDEHTGTEWKRACREEGEAFLHRVVTGGETWDHNYEPATKRHSIHWKHTSSSKKKKAKSVPSAGKVILTHYCSKLLYVDRNLQSMKRTRMRCVRGFARNGKHT
jgi:hypothetical protein